MSDQISYVKSSSGRIDAAFVDSGTEQNIAHLVGISRQVQLILVARTDGSTFGYYDTNMSLPTGVNLLARVTLSSHIEDIDYIHMMNVDDMSTPKYFIPNDFFNATPGITNCIQHIANVRILIHFLKPYEEMKSDIITMRYQVIKSNQLVNWFQNVDDMIFRNQFIFDNNGYINYTTMPKSPYSATCSTRIPVMKGDKFYCDCGMGESSDDFRCYYIVDSANKILYSGPRVYTGEIEITQDEADAIVFTNYTSARPKLIFFRLTSAMQYVMDSMSEQSKPDLAVGMARIFKKVICCGDSYTAAYIDNGTVYRTNEDYAWPSYMSMITGQQWLNCGDSGKTTKTWLTSERGLPYCKTLGKAQAYVIGLMINDNDFSDPAKGLQTGTIADIGTDANTYYAWLSRDVRELHKLNPDAKIFINTCPKDSTNYDEKNKAVRDVVEAYAETYHTHCIDLAANKDLYNVPSLTGDFLAGHYTAIGYEQFAEIYNYLLSKYIGEHITDFQDVFLIGYDDKPIE